MIDSTTPAQDAAFIIPTGTKVYRLEKEMGNAVVAVYEAFLSECYDVSGKVPCRYLKRTSGTGIDAPLVDAVKILYKSGSEDVFTNRAMQLIESGCGQMEFIA